MLWIINTNRNLTSINFRCALRQKQTTNKKLSQQKHSRNSQYQLVLTASDSRNENFTKININVRDVNDLPPVFAEKLYCKVMDEEIAAPFPMIQVPFNSYTKS